MLNLPQNIHVFYTYYYINTSPIEVVSVHYLLKLIFVFCENSYVQKS